MCSYDQITFGEYHYLILNPASPTFQPAMVHEDPDCPICDPIMATGNASHIKPLYRAAFGQGFSFGFYHQFGSMMDATSDGRLLEGKILIVDASISEGVAMGPSSYLMAKAFNKTLEFSLR